MRRNWNFLGRFGAVKWMTHTWICKAKPLCSGQEAPGIHFLLRVTISKQTVFCPFISLSNTRRWGVPKHCNKDTVGLGSWKKTFKNHTVHSLGTVLLPRKLTVWRHLVLVTQSCPTRCNPMDCSLPGSTVHRIFQARILEWVAISSCRRSSWPRDWTQVPCIAGRFLTFWASRKALRRHSLPKSNFYLLSWLSALS